MYVQEDVFQSVGVPLVRNALAGYNTSILSYGQVHFDFKLSSEKMYSICYGSIEVNGY